MEERKYCVYVHTNKINGKKYVGVTSLKPDDRWQNGRGYSHNKYFTNAIKKYGWSEGFTHEIVAENLSVEDAYQMERELIQHYDCMNPNGYNATSGGEIGKEYSEETRKKIGENTRNQSEETRRKRSESAKARCTDEWRKAVSDRMKGKWSGENNPNFGNYAKYVERSSKSSLHDSVSRVYPLIGEKNPMYGKKHTDESKEKISQNRKGKLEGKDNPRARQVVQLTKDGEFIRQWDYITQAADFFGVKPWNIITCCTHPDKLKSAYGFKWMYIEDYEKITQQNDLNNNKE